MESDKTNKKSNQGRGFLIGILCMLAILQSGLRDISQLPDANDTPNYQYRYEEVSKSSWGELFDVFSVYSSEYGERDRGYPIFMKVTQVFINDFTFFMFLTSAIFIVSLSYLINKYVKSFLGVILSFLIYFALFTNIVDSFMRQAITLSIVLFALRYILTRDWKRYFLLVLIALTIHSSAIVAVPFYFLPRLCGNRKWLLLALIISPVMVYCIRSFMAIFLVGTVYGQYTEEDAENPMNYIMLVYVVSLFVFICFDKLKEIKDSDLLMSASLGSLLLLPITAVGNTVLRISYYYVLFVIVLVPIIIDNIKMHKLIRLLVYTSSTCFFLYFIAR